MEIREYQEESKRTLNKDLEKDQQLANMVIGIMGESGEVADLIKKHLYQGHPLDREKVTEEIGDVMFYLVNLCNILEIDLKTAISRNYYKLLKRYPNGFDVSRSVNRQD